MTPISTSHTLSTDAVTNDTPPVGTPPVGTPLVGTLIAPDATLTQPIGIILSTQGESRIIPGETLEISVTVTNKGNQSAVIDIFLDELPEAIQDWCSSTQTRLALDPGQGEEVVFKFAVPLSAMSGGYRYWLVVDAPNHYLEHPRQRYEQNLQVLPPTHTAIKVNDPTFAIAPITTSTQPAKVIPGTPVQFQVHVHNRANRVDRFHLQCKDLPADWLTFHYPQGFQLPGLAAETHCLDLNPNESGIISLTINPPAGEIAKIHLATLQLKAENDPTLKLFDILYLDIQPTYQIEARFRTLISRIHHQPGLFSIQASNRGNTPRSLSFKILGLQDSDLCDYAIEPPSLRLAPHQTLTSQIAVRPKHRWKRPLLGAGRLIQFEVITTDPEEKPLPEIPMTGMITWAARPLWQIIPAILLLLGSVAGLIWLVWWTFLRPPVPASILQFAAEDTVYEASQGDAIHVGFEIAHPEKIQQIEIIGQSAEGEILSGPLTFDLAQGLPPQLTERCLAQKQQLICRNIRTDAKKEGDYSFTLTLIPQPIRNMQPTQATAPPVAIVPVQPPSIVEIVPSTLVYTESLTGSKTPEIARVNWKIDHPGQLKAIELVARDSEGNAVGEAIAYPFSLEDFPPDDISADELSPKTHISNTQTLQNTQSTLSEFCTLTKDQLICNNVPTGIQQAGTYAFELTAIPLGTAPEEPIIATSEQVQIQSRSPKLISFTLNGQPAQPSYLIPIEPGTPPISLALAWEAENTPGTQVMLTPAPGTVPTKGTIPIWLSPEAKETMVSLQVTGATGESITRSINITTYDPTPEVPTIIVNTGETAEQAADQAGSAANGSGNNATNNSGNPSSGTGRRIPGPPGSVSPAELPPRFE